MRVVRVLIRGEHGFVRVRHAVRRVKGIDPLLDFLYLK